MPRHDQRSRCASSHTFCRDRRTRRIALQMVEAWTFLPSCRKIVAACSCWVADGASRTSSRRRWSPAAVACSRARPRREEADAAGDTRPVRENSLSQAFCVERGTPTSSRTTSALKCSHSRLYTTSQRTSRLCTMRTRLRRKGTRFSPTTDRPTDRTHQGSMKCAINCTSLPVTNLFPVALAIARRRRRHPS